MTNPSNMVRVRARNGGRASVYEANGWAQAYTQGVLSGYGVTQNLSADMNVLVGGTATNPDVVLATNPAGYKVALDLVSTQAVAVTAPATNKRISAIVAYTNDLSLATTQSTVTGSPASCGLIVVNGTAAANPTEPTDNQIRTAITADGATGSQAAYCIVATILVASGTTAITDNEITVKRAGVMSSNIDYTSIEGWSNMPVASTTHNLDGSSMTVTLTRIGNIVFVSGNFAIGTQSQADADPYNPTWGLFPTGYRPSNTEQIIMQGVVMTGASAGWEISSDGKKTWSTTGWTGNERFYINTSWITADSWPV